MLNVSLFHPPELIRNCRRLRQDNEANTGTRQYTAWFTVFLLAHGDCRTRTYDPSVNSRMLCQLS